MAPTANLGAQLSTAHREALDDAWRGRYSRSLIAGFYTQLPSHRPMRGERIGGIRLRFVFLLDDFLLGRLFASQGLASCDSAEPHSVLPRFQRTSTCRHRHS